MALYLIVFQAHFVMNNVFEGMIWFFLPAALVITNDIFAYVCGIAFGRTQLIKLSPKKTVEGFVGAWIMTLIWAMLLVNLMTRSKYFICPVNVSLPLPSFLCSRPPNSSRISAPTSSPVSSASSTPYSSPTPTSYRNTISSLPTRTCPSPSPRYSCTLWFWQRLPRSSLPLVVSSPPASSAASRSKILATPFLAMAA